MPKCLASARDVERQVTLEEPLEEPSESLAKRDLFLITVTKHKALPSVRVAQCKQTAPRSHLFSSSGAAGTPFCTVLPWEVCTVMRPGVPGACVPSLDRRCWARLVLPVLLRQPQLCQGKSSEERDGAREGLRASSSPAAEAPAMAALSPVLLFSCLALAGYGNLNPPHSTRHL